MLSQGGFIFNYVAEEKSPQKFIFNFNSLSFVCSS